MNFVDNPINRKVLLNLLKSLGYNADYVCDGAELVKQFNANQHKIVITDMVSYSVNNSTNSCRTCQT